MKLVREHINEKFTEESDPIHDMGIGGMSFETLRPGAIIQAKKAVAVTHNRSGAFTAFYSGFKILPDHYVLVTNVIRHSPTVTTINFMRFRDKDLLNRAKEELKETEKIVKNWYPGNNMIVSRIMFNNRFIIIERGF